MSKPVDAEHALVIGMVMGTLLRGDFEIEMIDDEDGDHQAEMRLFVPLATGKTYIVSVQPDREAE